MRTLRLLVSLIPLMATTACLSSAPKEEHFYNLTGPSVPLESGTGPTLDVLSFSAAPGYDSVRLAYRVSPNELRFYASHKWAADPAAMVRSMVANHLRASGQFSQVGGGSKDQEPDGRLSGTVVALEEVDAGDAWKARLALRLVLQLGKTDEVIFRHGFDISAPCKERHPRDVARAVSEALAKEMKDLAPRLADAIRGVTSLKQPGGETDSTVPQPTPAPVESVGSDDNGGK